MCDILQIRIQELIRTCLLSKGKKYIIEIESVQSRTCCRVFVRIRKKQVAKFFYQTWFVVKLITKQEDLQLLEKFFKNIVDIFR